MDHGNRCPGGVGSHIPVSKPSLVHESPAGTPVPSLWHIGKKGLNTLPVLRFRFRRSSQRRGAADRAVAPAGIRILLPDGTNIGAFLNKHVDESAVLMTDESALYEQGQL